MTAPAKRTPYLAPLVDFIEQRPCTAFAMFLVLQFAVTASVVSHTIFMRLRRSHTECGTCGRRA